MKGLRKLTAFLLAMVLCAGIIAIPAIAETLSADGLEVTLNTDKDSYSQSESVTATLTVKNKNDFAISNVSLENMIPSGWALKEGSKSSRQVESLDAGQTVSLKTVYVEKTQQKETASTGAGDNTNKSGDTGGSSGKSGTKASTGYGSYAVLWISLAVLAGIGLCVLFVLRKKSGRKLLSMFLCISMAGGMALSKPVAAEAADVQGKSVAVSVKVKADSADLTIESVVKYDMPVEEEETEDVGEVSFRKPSDEHIALDEETGVCFVDNEILVVGKEDVPRQVIEEAIGEVNGVVVGIIEVTNDYQVEVPGSRTVSELNEIAAQLGENEAIEEAMVHELYLVDLDEVPNDAEWSPEEWSSEYPEGNNWGVEAINAMGAWDHYDEMSYVKVGLIDSMFDTGHEDLVFTKVWNNPQSVTSESLEYADRSHGTHVSGTFAACYNNNKGVAGVAPKVTLYGYSILGSDTDSTILDANKRFIGLMEWKYALAKLITSKCKVINVSMTSSMSVSRKSQVLGTYLNKLITKGYDFVIVQSAGNDSEDAAERGVFNSITIPAVRDRVIVVGAIGTNKSHKNGLFGWFGDRVFDGYYYADFSNFGERVDIAAPGVKIYSTVLNNGYENEFVDNTSDSSTTYLWQGTSMAAPHVTGIAAMCYSVNPALTGAQVKSIIVNSATTTVTDTNSEHPLRSYPVADANAAVEMALQTDGEVVSAVNPSNGFVMGNVMGYNAAGGKVTLSDVSVSAYRISDYDGNLSQYASSSKSDEYGNYELILEAGKYYINIYKEGYLPFAICDVTVQNDEIVYMDNVVLILDSGSQESGYIHGRVYNALDGSAIEGADIRLRAGWNNKYGVLVQSEDTGMEAVSTTNSSGEYSFYVQEGCYTAEINKDGFITGYANVICTDSEDSQQDAVLTPVLSDDEYRVVLTWSETPSDLDSHMSGPLSSGDRFHVYYSHKSADDNGETVANLDKDDTTSYGPETITLKQTQDGVYRYAVHDYTNRNSSSSSALSMSGAKVELYRGNSLVATYHVPVNTTGTVWNVFEIEGNVFRSINTMENQSNPANVCALDEVSVSMIKNQYHANAAFTDNEIDPADLKENETSSEDASVSESESDVSQTNEDISQDADDGTGWIPENGDDENQEFENADV